MVVAGVVSSWSGGVLLVVSCPRRHGRPGRSAVAVLSWWSPGLLVVSLRRLGHFLVVSWFPRGHLVLVVSWWSPGVISWRSPVGRSDRVVLW